MKPNFIKSFALTAAAGWLTAGIVHADIPLPVSNFTDGPLILNSSIPTNIVVDLSRAVTGVWSNSTVGTNIGYGIYDPEKWAVVFKYTSVSIHSNVTLNFINHPSHAPVVWIVGGNLTINGHVKLDGEPGNTFARHTEPGPGGGYGGIGETSEALPASDGFGWGGGLQNSVGGAGSHSTAGRMFIPMGGLAGTWTGMTRGSYGVATCLPLRGGSGGSGSGEIGTPLGNTQGFPYLYTDYDRNRAIVSGGGGGGAIMMLCGRSVVINGRLSADGGTAATVQARHGIGGGGSGGAVRLIGEVISGDGSISAQGFFAQSATLPGGNQGYSVGGNGRIRLESMQTRLSGLTTLPGASVVPLAGLPQLWPEVSAPSIRILRVAQTAVTPTPLGNIDSGFTDAQVNAGPNETEIVVEGQNLTNQAQVDVRVVPKFGSSEVVHCSFIGETNGLTYWRAVARLVPDLSVLQARATGP